MKPRVEGVPGSSEWRVNFRAARDTFVATMCELAATHGITSFVACDQVGNQVPWIWNDDKFRYSEFVGTVEHARVFAEDMIGQGMRFAYAIEESKQGRMWLTTYEPPVSSPCWPAGLQIMHEEIWEGVRRT